MCYTWDEKVILVLWLDSWFLGRSWWWERPTKLSKSGSSFGILGDFEEMRFVHSNGQTLWSGSAMGKMAQWYGRWWQSVSFTELMMASDVLFCSVMSPLATRLPANTRRQQTNTALFSSGVEHTTAFYSTSESKAVGTFSIFRPSEENLALSGTATVKPVNEWMEFRQKGRTASQLCPTRSLALCVHKFKIANSSDLIWNQVVQKQEVKELGRKLLAFPVDQIDQSEFICEERGKGRICILWISDQSSQTYL